MYALVALLKAYTESSAWTSLMERLRHPKVLWEVLSEVASWDTYLPPTQLLAMGTLLSSALPQLLVDQLEIL